MPLLNETDAQRRAAMKFIICLGFVSLFADMTYEGAASIIGPFFRQLGATGFEVGMIAGVGEMLAASLRYFSGRMVDRTRAYWIQAMLGYIMNLIVVPAMAFAGNFQVAALLVICERSGKALRGPARDVLLSEATGEVGHGWGFGIHGAMDQTGAMLGPIWVGIAVLRHHQDARSAFLALAIPAAAALTALIVAKAVHTTKGKPPKVPTIHVLPRVFWTYTIAAAFLAFGYADFALLSFHWTSMGFATAAMVPFIYSAAMGTEGLTGLFMGKLFDRFGIAIMAVGCLVSMFSLPLGFLGGIGAALGAMACWAVGMGTQDACLRSGISQVVSMNKRGSAFGAFYGVWGVLWFAGSGLMGYLLDHNVHTLVAIGMAAQLIAAVMFFSLRAPLAEAATTT